MIALFVGRELLFSSFRRFPQNRGNEVAVFEGSPIRYNNAFIQSFFTLVWVIKYWNLHNCFKIRVAEQNG